MRELGKSTVSFFWALSLFGVRQTMGLGQMDESRQRMEDQTSRLRSHLGGLDRTFEAGDRLQREVVDAFFALGSQRALDPGHWADLSSRLFRRSTELAKSVVPGEGGSSNSGSGWGPMPPVD